MSGSRILIVEDELLVASDLKETLHARGHTVVGMARTAEEAVECAAREKPDLILMDVRLAGIRDGVSAALEIKARFQASVLFLTAFSDAKTLERAKPVEPLAYITKPFKRDDLIRAVELALYRVEMERERSEAARTILFFATHDPLTGLLNRAEFLTRMTIATSNKASAGPNGALIFYDLADFKLINDSKGHAAGDIILSETGNRMNAVLTDNECACRWGGDEFLLFIKNYARESSVEESAREMADVISQPNRAGIEVQVDYGIVCGVSTFPSITLAIEAADRRMYEAKRRRMAPDR